MIDPKIVIDDVYRTLSDGEVFIRNITIASENIKEEDVLEQQGFLEHYLEFIQF